MAGEWKPETLIDALEDFDGGVNQTRSPLKLARNVMSHAVNTTVRGDFATHRPPYKKRLLAFANDTTKALFQGGLFQGACFYNPDNAPQCIMAAISGNLFKLGIVLNTVTVSVVSGAVTQSATADQHWLWQAEKWVIWNDGVSNPVFYDDTIAARSNYGAPVQFNTVTAVTRVSCPAKNAVTVAGNYLAVTDLDVGDVITIHGVGTMQVMDNTATQVILLNLTCPQGYLIPLGKSVTWSHSGTQLPPGRMGAYGSRVWMSLIDGKQFIAGDAVGGSSGTVANNFRDAVLNITENSYLSGGGTFAVPGSVGDITAMRFAATLDASLGQGPLQVFTATRVFSVNSPAERSQWQDITNPILTESLISNGAKGQNSTVLANGDFLFRSIDGIRSLILARREFDTWGNTPVSYEVADVLSQDDPGLLRFGSAMVFDNRLLMTTHPISHAQGVYHIGLVPINFDPVSSLRGKLPSVYDAGLWTGLNVLQLVVGDFNDVERGFALVLNTTTGAIGIELWELSTDKTAANGNTAPDGRYDNDGVNDIPIVWRFRSAALKFGQDDPRKRQLLSLKDGELYVEDLVGTVQFEVNYWPDQWPCPVPWFRWEECQGADDPTLSRPGFRPRMGLGEPSAKPCDPDNNRPLREAYTYMLDLTVKGHCTFLGARIKAVTQPQPEFSRPSCNRVCTPDT